MTTQKPSSTNQHMHPISSHLIPFHFISFHRIPPPSYTCPIASPPTRMCVVVSVSTYIHTHAHALSSFYTCSAPWDLNRQSPRARSASSGSRVMCSFSKSRHAFDAVVGSNSVSLGQKERTTCMPRHALPHHWSISFFFFFLPSRVPLFLLPRSLGNNR